MESVMTSRLQTALDVAAQLSPDEQESLIDILHKRLVMLRREEIARNAVETLAAAREGRATYGSLDDLKRDLLEETDA